MTTADDTRSRILAAARRLFAERGYAGTSLADIATAVGLTKTAVAYHFHPKDRLAAELLAPCADDMITLLGAEFADRDALLEALVAFVVRHRTVLRLIMEDVGGADDAPPGSTGEAIRTFRDELLARLVGPEPDAVAQVRGWAVLGALQWAVVHTTDLPEELVRAELLRAARAI
ncbi:TetR family transcriptional regulator [Nonomuraea sp. SMC257]|uniref:TetR family transcriptional regulator n=1 Tax=Nonomuraea montanisoli TaxID=2741721 RepID=A0A7Y6IFN3_9ACTN|nr:TetR family transcriptional regulator [Nonomuraea montanisoli]NUW36760.1 TetR family transcriptional regulator [Nonomuraea montanisoli]